VQAEDAEESERACVVGAVLSFVREGERIFLRWLSEVERLLDHQVDPMLHSRRGPNAIV
jgi:hypothetical protein